MLSRLLPTFLIALIAGTFGSPAHAASAVRIACVGDSITAGYGLKHPAHDAWPAVLSRLLGPEYAVKNFGVSGATLLKNGDKPYWKEPGFAQADAFDPQIVVIILGTNDSKPHNWSAHGDAFATDAAALIEHFAQQPDKPTVWVCLPVPIFANPFTIDEATTAKIRQIWRKVAAEHHVSVIDPDPAFDGHPDFFIDGVQPTIAGAEVLAHTIAEALKPALAEPEPATAR